MNIAGLTACVQLTVNDNFETGTGWTGVRRTGRITRPACYAGVKVTVWMWLLTLVESLVTVWRLRSEASSA